MFVESSFHLNVESNQRLRCAIGLLNNSRHFVIQSEKEAIKKRDSRANIFPRFVSGTQLLRILIGSLDCPCLLLLTTRVITLALVSRYSLVTNSSFTHASVLHEKDKQY